MTTPYTHEHDGIDPHQHPDDTLGHTHDHPLPPAPTQPPQPRTRPALRLVLGCIFAALIAAGIITWRTANDADTSRCAIATTQIQAQVTTLRTQALTLRLLANNTLTDNDKLTTLATAADLDNQATRLLTTTAGCTIPDPAKATP